MCFNGRLDGEVVYDCEYHVLWCVKYKRKVLDGPVADRLLELLNSYADERDVELVRVCIAPDCVSLVLRVSPVVGIHRVVKGLKAHTSRLLRREFPFLTKKLPSLWTNSYLVCAGREITSVQRDWYMGLQKVSQRYSGLG